MPRSHSATDKYKGSFAFSSPGRSAQCAARRHHRISILHGLPISRRAGRARLAIRWTCEANKKGTSNTLWKTERQCRFAPKTDRKSAGKGRSVSVRVAYGGSRIVKKK